MSGFIANARMYAVSPDAEAAWRELLMRVGDEAVLIGRQGEENISAEELATHAGTISYEILTTIGERVKRVYRDA